jgi:hypothetical protein
MTQSSVAFSDATSSTQAGISLGTTLLRDFEGSSPQAVIVFASARYDYEVLLKALHEHCQPEIVVGCSSAGEFINGHRGEHSVSAIGLRSTDIRFSAGIGLGVSQDADHAARAITGAFEQDPSDLTLFRSALVLTDALSGYADDLVSALSAATNGTYTFFGGGAGDDAQFTRTHVFLGTEVYSDAAVALEILSTKPVGIGVQHGWEKGSAPLRVTESDGMQLISIDGAPAIETIEAYARTTGQAFEAEDPLPFFLHNVLGIETGAGIKLRVPLGVGPDGSIACAAEIPEGATLYIMRTSNRSAADAAGTATRDAVEQLQGHDPEIALFFDCVATRLRLGDAFGLELESLQSALGDARYAGCNTYGQIARAPGQFSGFHNCTAVVCVLPA